jgi:hypothetical protein
MGGKAGWTAALYSTMDKNGAINFIKFMLKLGPLPLFDASVTIDRTYAWYGVRPAFIKTDQFKMKRSKQAQHDHIALILFREKNNIMKEKKN